MKIQKCYSSLARRRMHHVIYRHCIQFSQIHVTQSLSVKSGYSNPKLLNRTFGHLAVQNSHLRENHENELPNHGVHARRGTSPSSWVPITDTFNNDDRAIFSWCRAQLSQHGSGTGEGTTLQGVKKRKSTKTAICLAPEGIMSPCSTADRAGGRGLCHLPSSALLPSGPLAAPGAALLFA